jgi:Ca-activated chloride channel family protein
MTKLIETKSIIIFLLSSTLMGQDKGQKLFEQKKYDEARRYYESILDKRDEDKAALFGVGSSSYYLDDIEGALNSFGNTLDSEDDQLKSKSYYNLARILQDKNELEKSLSLYRKSLELDPTDIDAKVNYELLKRQISQNQKDENQSNEQSSEKNENENSEKEDENQSNEQSADRNENENSEKEDENQSNEQSAERNENENSEKEDENNELAEQNKKEQEESKGDKQDEADQNIPDNEGENKSDELMQAEAILNALKDQEKINQKQKILKTKSLKFDKDW